MNPPATLADPSAKPALSAAGGRRRHVAALDGIRAIAVIAVMLTHSLLIKFGGYGVDVFFVLSGYLISGILLDERQRYGRVRFFNFYARRFLRLVPALWLMVALYLIASRILHRRMNPSFQDAGMAVAYISNWTRAFFNRPTLLGHTWSLSVEEQFYILWPPLVLLFYRLFGRTWVAALACLAGVAIIVARRVWLDAHGASGMRISNGLDSCSDPLLCGAALAFFLPKLSKIPAAVVGWLGALLLTALFFNMRTVVHDLPIYPLTLHNHLELFAARASYSHLTPSIATLLIMIGLLNSPKGWVAFLLSLPPLPWIGRISYGIYLFHFPIMVFMIIANWRPQDIALTAIPSAFILATISYYSLEKPCLRLKDRFRPPPERGREGVVAVDPTPITAHPFTEPAHAAGN